MNFLMKNIASLLLAACLVCGGLECICPIEDPIEEPPVNPPIITPFDYGDFPGDW